MARIGVNALYLIPGGVGGTEIYLRELLAALAAVDSSHEYFVFTNMETQSDLLPKQANFHWKPQAVHARFRPARILWEQIVLPFEAARYRLDVLFNPGFTAPIFSPCRQVTVFHDLQHKRHPEYFRWFDLPFWRLLLWAAAHRSHRLIAVSEATRSDLLRFYHIPKERVAVIAHGVEPAFSRLDRSHTESYLLCVSTLHPHKNLPRLIRAYGLKKRDFRLILAGLRGFHTKAIEQLIGELGLRDSVQITGWVPREELYSLYERARAFVYPSMFEGFGMPVLEALAAGIPVACSDIPPLHEVAGDAALFFNPLDEDAIAAAIEHVMTDAVVQERLTRAGRERARGFTWKQSAERTREELLRDV
ncbi:MAG: glycosyl transferase, group 1 [Bryobacterales bacterium]|jgi:glycosyltransferase involved in cell wall biosynthesis|nr:glycosyl transferase, group 1 [Bryobacterales bacterium]